MLCLHFRLRVPATRTKHAHRRVWVWTNHSLGLVHTTEASLLPPFSLPFVFVAAQESMARSCSSSVQVSPIGHPISTHPSEPHRSDNANLSWHLRLKTNTSSNHHPQWSFRRYSAGCHWASGTASKTAPGALLLPYGCAHLARALRTHTASLVSYQPSARWRRHGAECGGPEPSDVCSCC